MQPFERAFESAERKLARAAGRTMSDMASGFLPDEPSVTAGLVTRLHDALDGFRSSGISWSAKILTSHGPNTEERKFGADFLGVLTLDLPGYKLAKGFLAQAKRQEPGSSLNNNEWMRLREQCTSMLTLSPASFVFVYSWNGVTVVPATAIAASSARADLHTLHPKRFGGFYAEHFRCFVGDQRIGSASTTTLERLTYQTGLEIGAQPQDQLN